MFRRARFAEAARGANARVLREIAADVVCVVEFENRPALQAFGDQFLAGRYPHTMVIDGNDRRGIDVGVLSRLPIAALRTHLFDKGPDGAPLFDRDCLEVDLSLPDARTLHLLCNHFKSKRDDAPERRMRQAERVREICARFDLGRDLVAVAGDLNDTPDSAPLRRLASLPGLSDILDVRFGAAAERRWTHARWPPGGAFELSQIDFLLVSDPLRAGLKAAGVERRGINDLEILTGGAERAFPTVTDRVSAASDHGAVWADFVV